MDFLNLLEGGTLCLPLFMLAVLLPMTLPEENVSEGFSESDFLYSKYLKCVLVVGSEAVQDIVRAIYSRLHKLCPGKEMTRNGTMSVREYNMRANVDPYFGDMECFLDCNIMEKNFDISFGYRLLKEEHICGEVFRSKFKKESQDRVSDIIEQRNKVCHEYGNVTDLSNDVDKLKSCIEDVYNEASQVLQVDFSSNIKNKIGTIDMIMKAKITDAVGLDCLQGLKTFKESLRFRLLHEGRCELSRYYQKLRTLSPCSWVDSDHAERFNIEKIFTTPKLSFTKNKSKMNIPMKNLLEVKIKAKTIPSILLIKGLAGSGKTSLCRYLVHSWNKDNKSIDSLDAFHLVILIEISRASSATLLEYLCEELLCDSCHEFYHEDILSLLQDINILFIIDGYDEEPNRARALMESILDNCPNKRIIVTSRPNYEDEIVSIAKNVSLQLLAFILEGFDDLEQRDFSEKVFSIFNRSCDSFLMYLNGRGRVLHEHLRLPLTISLLIVLWMENPEVVNKITTATVLYYEIFNLFQEKLVDRLIVNLKGRQKNLLKKKVQCLLIFLGEQSWSLLKNGNGAELSNSLRSTLEIECSDKGIDAPEFFSAFLLCEIHSGPQNTGSSQQDKRYSFIHRTQMEYLAAEFLTESVECGKLNINDLDCDDLDWGKHSEVLVFLIGNMANRNILRNKELTIMNLAENVSTSTKTYCFWWKIISESRIDADIPHSPDEPIRYKEIKHPKIAKIIFDRHLSSNTDWQLDSVNVSAGLRLMCLVNTYCLLAKTLVIDIPDGVDPVKIPDFYDALSAVEFHWNQKIKKPLVKVDLHLRHHNSRVNVESSSDKFILALNNWAELQNFTGSLKEITDSFNKGYMKGIRCLVTSPIVLRSFEKLPDSVGRLRLTLGFHPDTCNPEDLKEIVFFGALELFVPDMHDDCLNWLIKVMRRLSRGDLKKLHLENCSLTYNAMVHLMKSLNGILTCTLFIPRPPKLGKMQERGLRELARSFKVEWME